MCNIWTCDKIYVTHSTIPHHLKKVLSPPQMVVTKPLNCQGLEHTAHCLLSTVAGSGFGHSYVSFFMGQSLIKKL